MTPQVEVLGRLGIDSPVLFPLGENLLLLAKPLSGEGRLRALALGRRYGVGRLEESLAIFSGRDWSRPRQRPRPTGVLLDVSVPEIEDRATIAGAIDLGGRPGVIQVTCPRRTRWLDLIAISRARDEDLPMIEPMACPGIDASAAPWWRSAVIYQVYIRSFADGDGDGLGDIAGLRSRLPYLANLGVDAVWINPWYPSPMKDGGYDVSALRDIEPAFGTLADARAMIGEAHQLGLRVMLDLVPNHLSDQHPWFQDALAAGPGSPERERFIFRDGCGPGGEEPPNNWRSGFGGPLWTRVTEADGGLGEWYLHLFTPWQPDLNWSNAEVRTEFEKTLRFWFGLGIDGFRVDVAHGLIKAEGLPDVGSTTPPSLTADPDDHPYWDRDEVHEIYRAWRALADSYDDPRVFVAEAWVDDPERLARYVRRDELHTAFNFDFMLAPWQDEALRESIGSTLRTHRAVGAPPTWVLSNHDTAREVSRYARPQGVRTLRNLNDLLDLPADFDLGNRRARAAALLMLALPGGAYVYQGEELGLPEVEDLPDAALKDPGWELSGHTNRGRDGCRVPIPWSSHEPPFGFSPDDASAPPWLPQPALWRTLTVESQTGDERSMLELYRSALHIRRAHPALGNGTLHWLDAPDGALAFQRDPGLVCIVNVSADPVAPPEGTQIVLSSETLTDDGRVPRDTTVWFAVDVASTPS